MENERVLSLKNITKSFNRQYSLNNVSFDLHEGEILTLMGENGAGKSVLLKILSGNLSPDCGCIFIGNKQYASLTSQKSIQNHIAYVPQDDCLFSNLSVCDNIFITKQARNMHKLPSYHSQKLEQKATELLKKLNCSIDVTKPVFMLAAAEKRMVSIAKGLALNPKILLLDEPTDALNEVESYVVLDQIRRLAMQGMSVLFVSHKIKEIVSVSDRIVVLRNSRVVAILSPNEVSALGLMQLSFGKDMQDRYPKLPVKKGGESLRVKGLSNGSLFSNIDFTLRKGEILGIAGLVGSGRSAIAKTIVGLMKKTSGEIFLHGTPFHVHSPDQANKIGIGFLPEDRLSQGIFSNFSVLNNIMASQDAILTGIQSSNHEKKRSSDIIDQLNIQPTLHSKNILDLSGGNQQKVLLARMIESNCTVFIMDEPTKSIDTGAKVEIYNLMNELVLQGKSILFISSDMNELLGMSDRVLVLFNGKIIKELQKEEFSIENVFACAAGMK